MPFIVGFSAQNLTWTFGHGGCDWGSMALTTGYNPLFNFSITITTNAVHGANCSAAYRETYPVHINQMHVNPSRDPSPSHLRASTLTRLPRTALPECLNIDRSGNM